MLAPGQPGMQPQWSTGAKTAVGTAVSAQSRMWFTIASGILNEIYFPDVDVANTSGTRFLVADGDNFFSDEKDDAEHNIHWLAHGVPAFQMASRCKHGRYELQKELICDPARDALLLNVTFQPARHAHDLRLYVTADCHIRDRGEKNNAWVGQYKGIPMLFAQRKGLSLAMASSRGFAAMSCGFVGKSDGLTDIRKHKRMTRFYTEAPEGNVAVTGEIDWLPCNGQFKLALACGSRPAEAGQQARAALLHDFSHVRRTYVQGWEATQGQYLEFGNTSREVDLYRASVAVMRTHESKRFPGAFVASLSIPWGFDRSDKSTGGYHVIWPRDLGEIVLGLLACGDAASARRAIFYLQCTQESNGNWSQNMWLDGTEHWTSTQMDGTSFAILIADSLRRTRELDGSKPWPTVRAAAGFLLRHGPVTRQDRWEANPGYSPYTMAVEIAAVLAAADFADNESDQETADLLRATADAWNEAIDELTYARGTRLSKRHGIEGYYVRITPPEAIRAKSIDDLAVELKNHQKRGRKHKAVDIVSPDALALVRFGLRSPNDPRILDTVHIIDATLKKMTSTGPVWHRYTDDGYGEHPDGSPFDGTGVGRGWPLLTGERAHYEVARGRFEAAEELRRAIEAQTSECGMLPEQVWESRDIPKRQLFNGRPTGSGMPLAWAHAEYVKLLRSIKERVVWNMPPQTIDRYLVKKMRAPYQIWTSEQPRAFVTAGKNLRVDSADALSVRWTMGVWGNSKEIELTESKLGLRWAVLPTGNLDPGARVRFAFRSANSGSSTDRTFEVRIR